MKEQKVYKPCVSQKQADMFHHAVHDKAYRETLNLSADLARGKHRADMAAGLWGKHDFGLCPKCHPDCEHVHLDIDGYCADCGLHKSLIEPHPGTMNGICPQCGARVKLSQIPTGEPGGDIPF